MAYTVDWITKIVSIPTADLTLVSGTRYSLSMSSFLDEIRRLEWEPTEGLWAPAILEHSNTRVDFAGVTYAPFDDIINGYTIQFTGIATRVDLLGSNNDLIDVLIATGISVVPNNSAGLQIVDAGGGGLTAQQTADAVWDANKATHQDVDSMGELQQADGSITVQDKTDIIEGVWDELTANHTIPGSTGQALADAGSAGNPWSSTLSGNNVDGTFGYLLQTTFMGYFVGIVNTLATAGATTIRNITGTQPNQV